MKIRMDKEFSYEIDASTSRNLPSRGVYEVPDKIGRLAVKGGFATAVSGKPVKRSEKDGDGTKDGDGAGKEGEGGDT